MYSVCVLTKSKLGVHLTYSVANNVVLIIKQTTSWRSEGGCLVTCTLYGQLTHCLVLFPLAWCEGARSTECGRVWGAVAVRWVRVQRIPGATNGGWSHCGLETLANKLHVCLQELQKTNTVMLWNVHVYAIHVCDVASQVLVTLCPVWSASTITLFLLLLYKYSVLQ